MKAKFILAGLLLAGAALSTSAQGYKDGIEFYKVGYLDNAKELLLRNIDAPSTDKAEAYYYLGQTELHLNNVAVAKDYFDKGVQANPKYAYNYLGQAAVSLKNGDAKTAEKLVKEAEKREKKSPALAAAIAKVYYEANNPAAYQKIIDKQITQARKWNIDDPNPDIYEGDTFSDKKEWGDAAGLYERAFTNDPDNAEAYVKYGNTYFNVNPKYAIQRLEELLAKRPNSALVQRELAEKFYSNDDLDNSIKYYGMYYRNPNHFAKDELRYSQLLYFDKKYDECVDVANKLRHASTTSEDDRFFATRLMLYGLNELDRNDEAIEVGTDLFNMPEKSGIEYEPNDFFNLADSYMDKEEYAKAGAVLAQGAAKYPTNERLLHSAADCYNAGKDYNNSIKYYKMVESRGKATANDLYKIALGNLRLAGENNDSVARLGQIAEARKYVKLAQAQKADDPQLINLEARIEKLAENNKINGGALNAYKKLVDVVKAKTDLDKEDVQYYNINAYQYMATYYMNNGQKELAKDYYVKWLENDPDNADLKTYVEKITKK